MIGAMALMITCSAACVAQDGRTIMREKAEGYRGIWFTLGQYRSEYGDKYSGGLGTYTANHAPIAIYSAKAGKTFFVYGGTRPDKRHLLIMASYYDHRRGVVPRPTIVCDKQGVNDPHDNGSIALDAQGHVWVFVSGRGRTRPGFKYRSLQPYSVDAFELISTEEMTYPQPWFVPGKGFLHLFTKYTRGRELYWETSPDGVAWSSDQKLAAIEGHYQVSCRHGNRIVSAFMRHPAGNVDKRTDLYVLQTSDFGRTWRTLEGRQLTLPLSEPDNPARIRAYSGEGKLVYINDVNFDRHGRPIVLYVVSKGSEPGPANGPRMWTLAHWTGSAWVYREVTASTHNYDMGSLYVERDGTWRIIGPTEPGPQHWGTGGEMAAWLSRDEGRTWRKVADLTASSLHNHSYARRPVDAHPGFYALWADGHAFEPSPSHLYFTNKACDGVWMLPETMDGDAATPVRAYTRDAPAASHRSAPAPLVEAAGGPLRVHPTNPRYFTDGSRGPGGTLKAVLLTGSHTWDNLVDMGRDDPPRPFDFEKYLDTLKQNGHNFIRLWAWDSTTLDSRANGSLGKPYIHHVAPQPWLRTGPGRALDGKPKFDLTRLNPAYFARLRSRVQEAGKRGIYVSVMLFEGWGMMHGGRERGGAPAGWPWRSHPFHKDNNINGVNGDTDGVDRTGEVHSLAVPAANKIQAAYIRKVVDTVFDLKNVLYEVINEGGNRDWNRWVIAAVRQRERERGVSHPIGLTGHGAERLASMMDGTADWVSPGRSDGYGDDPPSWSGNRPSLLDTDHIWGVGGSADWVWKAFTRGHNPLFMDPYRGDVLDAPRDQWVQVRAAMGRARALADRLDLAAMTPRSDLASSGCCLASPGAAYVVYVPSGRQVTVDLAAASTMQVQWIHPITGTATAGAAIDGGAKRTLEAPFAGPAVLFLSARRSL